MTEPTIQVLLVEDNSGDARLIREHLADAKAAGFKIETIQTLANALERCARPGIDVVLLDLGLPDSVGLGTLKAFRSSAPDLPVVVLTGLNDEKLAVQAIQAGAQDYLIKGEIGGALIARVLRYAIERKRAEESLRTSEKLYRSLFDNMLNGFAYCRMIFDQGRPQDFIYLNVNSAFESLTGLKNVVGKKASEVIPGIRESDMELLIIYGRVALTGKPEKFEKYVEAMKMWFAISVYSPEKGCFASVFDVITERKRGEQELKEAKALVESVLENVPLMIILKEATDLRFVMFNRAGEELLGYDRKALLGKNNLDLFPPEQAAHFMAKDREVLDGKVGMLDIPEEPILTAKKGQRLLHTRKVCIRGADGTTQYLLGISEDITERKLAEGEIMNQMDELRRWHTVTLGREGRILEVKKEVNELPKRLGEKPRYGSAEAT